MGATHDKRVDLGLCAGCGCVLFPEWTGIRCPECARENSVRTMRWKRKNQAKARANNDRSSRARVERARAAGECVICSDPSETREDGKKRDRCLACTRYAAQLENERQRRRRAAQMEDKR